MKFFQITGILFFLLLSAPGKSFSQDLLFLKDTTVLVVNIKDFNGQTITYTIPGDSPGKTYYLSKSTLDSLKYSDGKSIDFSHDSIIKKLPSREIPRNNLSIDMINTILGKPNLDYERLSKTGKTGFVLGLLVNLKKPLYHYWEGRPYPLEFISYSPHYFFVKTGINYYPFNHSLVREGSTRLSTGFELLIGSYRKVDYSNYYFDGDNYIYNTYPVTAVSFMWNIRESVYLNDHFQITGSLNISLLPLFTFFCPQAGFSMGF
jgi:hypothetical protein